MIPRRLRLNTNRASIKPIARLVSLPVHFGGFVERFPAFVVVYRRFCSVVRSINCHYLSWSPPHKRSLFSVWDSFVRARANSVHITSELLLSRQNLGVQDCNHILMLVGFPGYPDAIERCVCLFVFSGTSRLVEMLIIHRVNVNRQYECFPVNTIG